MENNKRLTSETVASIGVFALLAIYPVILTDRYFNVTLTKYIFFTVSSVVFFAVCLAFRLSESGTLKKIEKPDSSGLKRADIFFILFVAVATLSTVFSDHVAESISGESGRRMGLLMIFCLFFAYLFISKCYRIREYEFFFFGGVSVFMSVFGLFQFIGFDPLDLLKELSELDKVRFISTLGNINIYSSFMCLALPLAMYMFCFSEGKAKTAFWLTTACATFIGLLTAISDSGYIGLAAAMITLGIITTKSKNTFQRFLILLIAMLISGGIFGFIWKTFGDPERPSSVPNNIIINPWVVAGLSVAIGILLLAINIFKTSDKFYSAIRILIIVFSAVAVTAYIITVVYFTCFNKEADIGILSNYFRFTERWGNGRRYVWGKLLEIYADLPFHQKLIGIGPDTLSFELVARHNDEMQELFGFYYDNAHNDLIQYLVTLGLFGVSAYIMLIISAVKSCLRASTGIGRAMLLPIIAFFAQSLVNITQPITTPLFFVFLAFSQCRAYEKPEV